MAFLTTADYKTQIKDEIRDLITEEDSNVLTAAELTAQKEIESYLRQRYDVANIFNKTGSNRHALIVTYMVDMALYHAHSRINPKKIPDIRMDRYDAAIAWLKMVAKGDISPDLPMPEKGADEIRWGSNTKLGHYY